MFELFSADSVPEGVLVTVTLTLNDVIHKS